MDIRSELMAIFADCGFDTAAITDTTRFREDLDADSAELVEIGVAVEQRMPFDIDTAPFPALKTFGEMVTFIQDAPSHA